MDQPQQTLTKGAKGEGVGKERTSRSLDQKKKNRAGSNSRSSSSSSSSSSSGDRGKKSKKSNKDKSKIQNKTNDKSPQESPYIEGNNAQVTSKEDNKAKNDKKSDDTNNKTQNKQNGGKLIGTNDYNNNTTAQIYSRPHTSKARLESSPTQGFDNSERNPNRRNLGSSTDHVADQRPTFGPWRAPDPERQRLLVERLAPAKPPAPPDPRFNHWKNHFLYYWNIGIDIKPRRQGNYSASASPRRQQNWEGGSASSQNSYDNRLLQRRPKTSSARLGYNNNRKNNNNNMRLDLNNHPFTGSASVDGRHGMAQRGTQSAREYSAGECPTIMSGLDRRYMGLQAVSGPQMQEIVERLTKMTSAYNAKFAPNPHVWVDTEPGAHMVKRSNTTVG